jgi:hypothetical protein
LERKGSELWFNRTNMLRQRLLIAASLGAVACAQIAGFEQLTSKQQPNGGGVSGFAGSVATSGGTSGGADSKAGAGTVAAAGDGASAGALGGAGGNGSVASTAGMATTAGKAGSAGSAGTGGGEVVGGCNAQQLNNANFDAGPVAWDQASTAPGINEVADVILAKSNVRLTTAQVTPKSDDYLAWLGGRPNSSQGTRVNLLQNVQIPAKVSNLVVSGWIRIRTTEPVAADANDQLDLALQDDQDFWSFHVWRVADATDEWQWFEYQADDVTVLDAVRGRTLTFIAESKTDTSYETHFWLDSLSFIAECP